MPCIRTHCNYDCCLNNKQCAQIVFHARMDLFCEWMRSIGIWPRIFKMQRHYHYHACMLSGNIEHLWWINLVARACAQRNGDLLASSGSWCLIGQRGIQRASKWASNRNGDWDRATSHAMPIESVAKRQHIARAYFIYFFRAHHFGKYICFIIIVYDWARNLAHSMRIVWLLLLLLLW